MLEHRMPGETAELSRHAQHHRLRIDALKLDLALAEVGFDPGQRAEKIVVPERTAKFAIGDHLKPDIFLSLDNCRDFAVFDCLESLGGNFAILTLRARFLQGRGTQEAADMIGTKRRCCSLVHSIFFSSSPRKRTQCQMTPVSTLRVNQRLFLVRPPPFLCP